MKESILEFTNRVYGYQIPVELDQMRNEFCPSSGKFHCDTRCPIYQQFILKGLSCNGALHKYPEECRKIIKGGTKTDES